MGFCRGYPPWAVRESLVCRLDRVRVQTRRVPCAVIDGTVKIALVLKGYKRNIFRTSSAKAHMEWKQSELISRVLTVRGTTRYVFGAVPIEDEKGSIIADRLAQLVDSRRQCVEFVSVNFATKELHEPVVIDVPTIPGVVRGPRALGHEI